MNILKHGRSKTPHDQDWRSKALPPPVYQVLKAGLGDDAFYGMRINTHRQ